MKNVHLHLHGNKTERVGCWKTVDGLFKFYPLLGSERWNHYIVLHLLWPSQVFSWILGPTTQHLHCEVHQGISEQKCLVGFNMIFCLLWDKDSIPPSIWLPISEGKYTLIPALFVSKWFPKIHSSRNLWGLSSRDQICPDPELMLSLEIWIKNLSPTSGASRGFKCHRLEVQMWDRFLSSHWTHICHNFSVRNHWNFSQEFFMALWSSPMQYRHFINIIPDFCQQMPVMIPVIVTIKVLPHTSNI